MTLVIFQLLQLHSQQPVLGGMEEEEEFLMEAVEQAEEMEEVQY
jgi:hypothetical protein